MESPAWKLLMEKKKQTNKPVLKIRQSWASVHMEGICFYDNKYKNPITDYSYSILPGDRLYLSCWPKQKLNHRLFVTHEPKTEFLMQLKLVTSSLS